MIHFVENIVLKLVEIWVNLLIIGQSNNSTNSLDCQFIKGKLTVQTRRTDSTGYPNYRKLLSLTRLRETRNHDSRADYVGSM